MNCNHENISICQTLNGEKIYKICNDCGKIFIINKKLYDKIMKGVEIYVNDL